MAPQKQKPWYLRFWKKDLFERDLPFGHKVERDRTKYTRKQKHKNKDIDQ